MHRRGLVAGLRGGQIAAMACGLVVAIGVLRARPSIAGAAVALLAVCVGVGFATWPVGGRTAEEWAPDVLRHIGSRGQTRRASLTLFRGIRLVQVDVDELGLHLQPDSRTPTGRRDGRPARPLLAAGVLHDRSQRTFTAVCRVAAPGFVLLSEEDKATRVAAWAGVLASLARDGSSVHRVQWLERVGSRSGASLRDRAESAGHEQPADAAYDSYAALLEAESHQPTRHDVLLALTVHAGHAGRAVKAAGGGDFGACALLLREVASLRRRLDDASIEAGPVLGPTDLIDVVRSSYSAESVPVRRAGAVGAAVPPLGGRRSGLHAWPWPMGVEKGWSWLRADNSWHASFWIAEWPRTDVAADFMGPLLLSSEVSRTVSVVMEPTGPGKASRHVEQARTADIADAELRRRGGFLATARRRREEEVLADRELELADGHAHYRFSGYVTVSAASADELDDACARVEQAAGNAGLTLRRCYGDQANAFLCTLPLGRGLS